MKQCTWVVPVCTPLARQGCHALTCLCRANHPTATATAALGGGRRQPDACRQRGAQHLPRTELRSSSLRHLQSQATSQKPPGTSCGNKLWWWCVCVVCVCLRRGGAYVHTGGNGGRPCLREGPLRDSSGRPSQAGVGPVERKLPRVEQPAVGSALRSQSVRDIPRQVAVEGMGLTGRAAPRSFDAPWTICQGRSHQGPLVAMLRDPGPRQARILSLPPSSSASPHAHAQRATCDQWI